MIYLRQRGGQYAGPFKSRRDVERFIRLMELCGDSWAGAEVIGEEGVLDPMLPRNDRIG